MKLIRHKNGTVTKESCRGCKFLEYDKWFAEPVDVCYKCGPSGNMRQEMSKKKVKNLDVVLQERRTLSQVLLSAVITYNNGCNWRIIKKGGKFYITPGCYLLTSVTEDEKLLYDWFVGDREKIFKYDTKLLTGIVEQEVIEELLKKPKCKRCGDAL